jgi:hypothetical protein
MGLAERRIAASYDEEQLPAWKKKKSEPCAISIFDPDDQRRHRQARLA